jgi:hypothetical protein
VFPAPPIGRIDPWLIDAPRRTFSAGKVDRRRISSLRHTGIKIPTYRCHMNWSRPISRLFPGYGVYPGISVAEIPGFGDTAFAVVNIVSL